VTDEKPLKPPPSNVTPPVLCYHTPEPRSPRTRADARGERSASIGLCSFLGSFVLPTFRAATSLSNDHLSIALILIFGVVAAVGVATAVGGIVLARRITSWMIVGLLLNGFALTALVMLLRAEQ